MTQQQLKEKYYPLYIGATVRYKQLGIKAKCELTIYNIGDCIRLKSSILELKPLSDITDEDVIEVAKIYLPEYKWAHIDLVGRSFMITDNESNIIELFFDLSYSINGDIGDCWYKNKVVDSLRSRHYDIDNLIERGIAIDEKSLNK